MGICYGAALYMSGGDCLYTFGYVGSFLQYVQYFGHSRSVHVLAVLAVLRDYNGGTGIDAVVSDKDSSRDAEAAAADLGPCSNGGTIIFHPGSGRIMVDNSGDLGR